MCTKELFELCLSHKAYNFFVLVNGFHSGGSPLHHTEHNSLVRKSSSEPQVKILFFVVLHNVAMPVWISSNQKLDWQIIVDLNNIFWKLLRLFFNGLISKLHYKPSTKRQQWIHFRDAWCFHRSVRSFPFKFTQQKCHTMFRCIKPPHHFMKMEAVDS